MVLTCHVCGSSDNFTEELGLYFCAECRTQCITQRELIQSEEVPVGGGRLYQVGKTSAVREKRRRAVPPAQVLGVDEIFCQIVRLYAEWARESLGVDNADELNKRIRLIADKIANGEREPNLNYLNWRRSVCAHAKHFCSSSYETFHELCMRTYNKKRLRVIASYERLQQQLAYNMQNSVVTAEKNAYSCEPELVNENDRHLFDPLAHHDNESDAENRGAVANVNVSEDIRATFYGRKSRSKHDCLASTSVQSLDDVLRDFDKSFTIWPFFRLQTAFFGARNSSPLVLPHAFPHYVCGHLLYVAAAVEFSNGRKSPANFFVSDLLRWERLCYLPRLSHILLTQEDTVFLASNRDLSYRMSWPDRSTAVQECNALFYALSLFKASSKKHQATPSEPSLLVDAVPTIVRILSRLNLPHKFADVVMYQLRIFNHFRNDANQCYKRGRRKRSVQSNASVDSDAENSNIFNADKIAVFSPPRMAHYARPGIKKSALTNDFEMLIACHIVLALVRCYGLVNGVEILIDNVIKNLDSFLDAVADGRIFSISEWLCYLRVCRTEHANNSVAVGTYHTKPILQFMKQHVCSEVASYWSRKDRHRITRDPLWQHAAQLEKLSTAMQNFTKGCTKNIRSRGRAKVEETSSDSSDSASPPQLAESGKSQESGKNLVQQALYEYSPTKAKQQCSPVTRDFTKCRLFSVLPLAKKLQQDEDYDLADEVGDLSCLKRLEVDKVVERLRLSHEYLNNTVMTQLCTARHGVDVLFEIDSCVQMKESMPALRMILICLANTLECEFRDVANSFFRLYQEAYAVHWDKLNNN